MFSELSDCFMENDINGDAAVGAEAKIKWLRSEIIGHSLEFVTPFGKRLMSYADHTASARSLRFIENFILRMVLPVYGNTHTEDSFVGRTTGNLVLEAQKYVKACMGGTDEDAILFCGSGSTAAIKKLQEVMGIAIPSTLREQILGTLKKKQRWVVFVGPYEHHSNLLTWRQSLAEVVEIPLSKEGIVDLDNLHAALRIYKDRPKLGCFSAASNVTGIITETRSIASLLHAHGAFACFDYASCAPYMKIDMRSGEVDGYDAIFISPHKFMGGPGTPGILLMNKKLYLLGNSPPSTCGGGTVDFVNFDEQKTLYYSDIEHREDAGTPAIIQKVRTALAYYVKEFLTPELILSRELFFIEEAMSRLATNDNIQIYGPTTVKRIAILSFGVYPHINRPMDDDPDYVEGELFSRSFEFSPGWRSGQNSPINPCVSSPLRKWTRILQGSSPFLPDSIKVRKRNPAKSFFFRSRSPGRREHTQTNGLKGEPGVHTGKARGKPLHGRFIVTLLNDLFGIQARGGCSCAGPYGHHLLGLDASLSSALRGEVEKGYASLKPGWTRLSFGYYLTTEEFEFLLSAIEFVADFGARFLHLYDLNWKTGDWAFVGEQQVFIQNQRAASFTDPHVSAAGLNMNSSLKFDLPALTTQDYNTRLEDYLKTARYISERLPAEQFSGREIPHDVDPSLITFLI